MVTLIAGVINATAITVKAAVHNLDMMGLKWEEARENLIVQACQESPCVG